MDWYSWLSRSTLDPSLIYEYALVFSHNEVGEEDVDDFDHEFLQSMGISIGKHRLEILKLAKKTKKARKKNKKRNKKRGIPPTVAKMLTAVKEYFRPMVPCDNSAIVVAPVSLSGQKRRSNMLKRNKSVVVLGKEGRLMLTDGAKMVEPVLGSHGSSSVMRWDSMFEDLKPT